MPDDDWQDFWHYEDNKPDTMSWIILAAGIVSIVIVVCTLVFGLDLDLALSTRQFTERP